VTKAYGGSITKFSHPEISQKIFIPRKNPHRLSLNEVFIDFSDPNEPPNPISLEQS